MTLSYHCSLKIADALSFIHADAKLVHGALSPNCVFLSGGGLWKVAGFEFALSLAESAEVEVRTCRNV